MQTSIYCTGRKGQAESKRKEECQAGKVEWKGRLETQDWKSELKTNIKKQYKNKKERQEGKTVL